MWINDAGVLYDGDCAPGDRQATDAEVEAWQAAMAATKRPADISDRQFATGLWSEGLITYDEAHAFVSSGAIPAALQSLIDQIPDDATGAPTPRKLATMMVSGATVYRRDAPLVNQIGSAYGWNAATLDAKWRAWGAM